MKNHISLMFMGCFATTAFLLTEAYLTTTNEIIKPHNTSLHINDLSKVINDEPTKRSLRRTAIKRRSVDLNSADLSKTAQTGSEEKSIQLPKNVQSSTIITDSKPTYVEILKKSGINISQDVEVITEKSAIDQMEKDAPDSLNEHINNQKKNINFLRNGYHSNSRVHGNHDKIPRRGGLFPAYGNYEDYYEYDNYHNNQKHVDESNYETQIVQPTIQDDPKPLQRNVNDGRIPHLGTSEQSSLPSKDHIMDSANTEYHLIDKDFPNYYRHNYDYFQYEYPELVNDETNSYDEADQIADKSVPSGPNINYEEANSIINENVITNLEELINIAMTTVMPTPETYLTEDNRSHLSEDLDSQISSIHQNILERTTENVSAIPISEELVTMTTPSMITLQRQVSVLPRRNRIFGRRNRIRNKTSKSKIRETENEKNSENPTVEGREIPLMKEEIPTFQHQTDAIPIQHIRFANPRRQHGIRQRKFRNRLAWRERYINSNLETLLQEIAERVKNPYTQNDLIVNQNAGSFVVPTTSSTMPDTTETSVLTSLKGKANSSSKILVKLNSITDLKEQESDFPIIENHFTQIEPTRASETNILMPTIIVHEKSQKGRQASTSSPDYTDDNSITEIKNNENEGIVLDNNRRKNQGRQELGLNNVIDKLNDTIVKTIPKPNVKSELFQIENNVNVDINNDINDDKSASATETKEVIYPKETIEETKIKTNEPTRSIQIDPDDLVPHNISLQMKYRIIDDLSNQADDDPADVEVVKLEGIKEVSPLGSTERSAASSGKWWPILIWVLSSICFYQR